MTPPTASEGGVHRIQQLEENTRIKEELPSSHNSPRDCRFSARSRLASSSVLCQEVMNLSAPCNAPVCHGIPPSFCAAEGQSSLLSPNVNRLSSVEPSVAPKAWKSSRRHFIQFCSGHPGPGSSPPASVLNVNRFGNSSVLLSS